MLKLKKHLALFLFAASASASVAYALPIDPYYMCMRACTNTYNYCLRQGTPATQCAEERAECRANCADW